MTVVQHFDVALRETPYDAFVGAIADRVELAGFLMTPDSAFGYERGGTPETVAALGRELGFDVVVVPPFALDGEPVRSADDPRRDRRRRPRRGAAAARPAVRGRRARLAARCGDRLRFADAGRAAAGRATTERRSSGLDGRAGSGRAGRDRAVVRLQADRLAWPRRSRRRPWSVRARLARRRRLPERAAPATIRRS